MNEQDGQSSGQDARSNSSISDVSVAFNDSPTLPFSFVRGGEDDRNDDEPARTEEEFGPEDTDDVGENGDNNSIGWHQPGPPPPAPSAVSPSLAAPEAVLPKMKITMPFMRAYKAMRGPRDVEPSPLFGCFIKSQKCSEGGSEQETVDDPFRLAGRDEVKLLNEVNDAIIRDCIDDKAAYKSRPFSFDINDDDDFGRQTVFYFDQPIVSPLLSQGTERLSEDCIVGQFDGDNNGDDITDHLLDHTKLDEGWTKAIGPFESDEEDAYVSDDDGDPAEVRISPAIFRALAAGCTLDDVDTLRQSASAEASLRPLTPQDKILDVSMDAKQCNNVVPYCHRRQFDIHTGEELSPVYRIEAGPASSILWSPPGVTPERAGLYLLLLQEGQGEQQQLTIRVTVISIIYLVKLRIVNNTRPETM
ncbi:hypothetical protein HMPREF1624_07282 [Sporothrix schenckii ATCC 58251]|uniref:Uncharacterized protein n=1 Tax=Sporothrix schenckii (strain ATCC 58251 / de Perez 2211183) TaxID=1391915 RepID=U7PLD9_SPOS1|nr:hypothetical protein HMPREF1624_07282 [Sporothrix schenckii ATCC 58251]